MVSLCELSSFLFTKAGRNWWDRQISPVEWEWGNLKYYSHCIINKFIAKHAVTPSHSPVSARADSVSNALRHFEFKFGLSAWSVVFSSCTPQRQSSLATHPPPLVEVDQAPTCSYPRCMPTASSVVDSSHNLILCDEVMSMQWGYGTSALQWSLGYPDFSIIRTFSLVAIWSWIFITYDQDP